MKITAKAKRRGCGVSEITAKAKHRVCPACQKLEAFCDELDRLWTNWQGSCRTYAGHENNQAPIDPAHAAGLIQSAREHLRELEAHLVKGFDAGLFEVTALDGHLRNLVNRVKAAAADDRKRGF